MFLKSANFFKNAYFIRVYRHNFFNKIKKELFFNSF
nr:MAG TPA: hypothetical protein [Caudoviricetes sp.]